MEYDIRHYDLESVPMTLDLITQNPKLLTLEVRAGIGGWMWAQPTGCGQNTAPAGRARREEGQSCLCPRGLSKGQSGHPVPKKSARAGRWEGLGCSPDFTATSRVALGKSLASVPYLTSTELA